MWPTAQASQLPMVAAVVPDCTEQEAVQWLGEQGLLDVVPPNLRVRATRAYR